MFEVVLLFYFCFCCLCFQCHIHKITSKTNVYTFSRMLSSSWFIVSDFAFKSLINFEFIFWYSDRKCSSFILLQVVDQFSQHHLLNRLSFSPWYILASFVKDNVSIDAWIYLWALYFVPLIYISVFVPVSYCLDDCSFLV